MERELGLLRHDGSPKPVLNTLRDFRGFLDRLPWPALPPRRTEAVCVLTSDQDTWGVAYSTFALAKQAGFDLEFRHESQPLPDAELYLLPCLSGLRMISRRRLQALLTRVEAGATLYLSLDSGLPSGFEPLTGLEPQTRERRREFGLVTMDGLAGAPAIPCGGTHKVRFRPTRATLLGREADGNPALAVAAYGRGRVYTLTVPMEMQLTRTPGGFHAPDAPPCHRVYAEVARAATAGRAVRRQCPFLAVTEHPLADTARVVVVVNHATTPVRESLSLTPGWTLGRTVHGTLAAAPGGLTVDLPANDATVFEIRHHR